MKKNEHKHLNLYNNNRRKVIKIIAASPLLLLSTNSEAGFWSFVRMASTRFVGGLIFDTARAVLVHVVKSAFSSGYGSYSYSGALSYYDSLPSDESQFYHPAYKAVVQRLGLSDAEYDAQRIVKLNITDDAQLIRIEALQRYLMDNKIRIVFPDNSSHLVTTNTTADDLFTIKDFWIDFMKESQRQQHYEKMIEITDSHAFKRWLS